MRISFPVVVSLCIALADVPLSASTVRVIALSGDQMPGRPSGQAFEFFAPPILNDSGQTAFFSGFPPPGPLGPQQYTGSSIWSEGTGTLALVAARGGQAPDVSGDITFDFFNQLGFNNAGKTVIRARLVGDPAQGINDFATYLETSAGLELVSRTGDSAPGIPGAEFGALQTLLLNDAGEIAFLSDVGSPPFQVQESIWHWEAGALNLVARRGDVAPGTGASFGIPGNPVLNDDGEVAFRTLNTTAIWSGRPGSIRLIARSGDRPPGTTGDEVFTVFAHPVINRSGNVAFNAGATDVGGGIWSDRSGALMSVVLSGDAAPGTPSGVTFSNVSSPVLNNAEHVAFWGQLNGTDVTQLNDTGIWADASGEIALVAREGDPATGTQDDLVFGEFDPASYALNANDQIAFLGRIAGTGITSSNDLGIWATDQNGALHLIAREGDPLEVLANEIRTISELRFLGGSGNGDSRPSGFNNVGQLAFYAQFTDESSGVFVSNRVANLPEPQILPGDYNGDDTVDAADYVLWRKTLGQIVPLGTAADGNGDGTIDPEDYNVWRTNFGNSRPGSAASSPPAVPEPSGKLLLVVAFGIALTWMRNGLGTVPNQMRT